MTTDPLIASRALSMLGANTITLLTDDTTEAEIAAVHYEPTVEWLLSRHRWNFAQKTALLVEDVPAGGTSPGPYTTNIVAGWDFAYDYPTDALRIDVVFSLNAPNTNLVWERHAEYLLSQEQPSLYVKYFWRVLTVNFPPFFKTALESELASRMALAITQRSSLADRWAAKAALDLRDAKLIDAQTSTIERMPAGNRLLAKRAGG